MKKTVCDRCGKEFVELSISNTILPYYEIRRWGGFDFFVRNVDLCKDCQRSFKEWLNSGKEDDSDGRRNTHSVSVSGSDGS